MAKGTAGAAGAKGAKGASGKSGGTAVSPPRNTDYKETPRFDSRQYRGALDEIDEIADELLELKSEREAIDARIAEKNVTIQAIMESVNDSESWSVCGDRWTSVYYGPGFNKKIVPELLIQQGVPIAKIEKATKMTPRKAYVQVKARRAGDGGEEE